MRVPVEVWQPCELLYTLVTYNRLGDLRKCLLPLGDLGTHTIQCGSFSPHHKWHQLGRFYTAYGVTNRQTDTQTEHKTCDRCSNGLHLQRGVKRNKNKPIMSATVMPSDRGESCDCIVRSLMNMITLFSLTLSVCATELMTSANRSFCAKQNLFTT